MPEQTKSHRSSQQKFHLPVLLFSYAVFALIFGLAYRYAINPDGTSMLRLAGYVAEGNFMQSISPGYSPLFTWLIAPFMYLGLEAQSAARITIALCGAGLLLGSWFLTLRFDIPGNMRFAAMMIAALLISFWTIQFISPDVLFAALLVCYLYLVTDPNVLNSRKTAFFCGVVGGFTCLAHHYAMPFFLIHFPVMLLLRGHMDRERAGLSLKRVILSSITGIAGFVIVVSLWVGIVSVKNGHLTISIKGGAAHAIMGPKDVDRRHQFFVGGLFVPKYSYNIHVFEDPSDVEYKTWSPFESKEYFIHQLKVIKINAEYIFDHFVNKSPFFTYSSVVCVLLFVPIVLFLTRLNDRKKFLYSWAVITFCIYCSGFLLLIARSPRRFYALMIVFLFLAFHFMKELELYFKDMLSKQKYNALVVCLLMIVMSAFALKPGTNLIKSINHIVNVDQVNPYKEIAEEINMVDFPSPYAVIRSSQKLTTDYYIAFFLKKQLLGRPLSTDLNDITRELELAGSKALLVFDKPEVVEELKRDKRYVHLASIKLDSSKRYEQAAGWVISKYEILNGWDEEVNIFSIK